mmetsp:Transcript_34257/g.101850  ORF Transcript_34257/g.101850 Transcript_34257/m.101850 type:complete len:267 (+) Transcript_34257:492-1292(+)
MATASRASASGPKRNCRARTQRVSRPVQMRAAASRRLKQQYAEVRASRQKTRCCSIASVKTTSPRASFHSRIMSRSHSSFMHGMWPEVVPVDASLALIAPCTTFAAPTTVSSPHLSYALKVANQLGRLRECDGGRVRKRAPDGRRAAPAPASSATPRRTQHSPVRLPSPPPPPPSAPPTAAARARASRRRRPPCAERPQRSQQQAAPPSCAPPPPSTPPPSAPGLHHACASSPPRSPPRRRSPLPPPPPRRARSSPRPSPGGTNST